MLNVEYVLWLGKSSLSLSHPLYFPLFIFHLSFTRDLRNTLSFFYKLLSAAERQPSSTQKLSFSGGGSRRAVGFSQRRRREKRVTKGGWNLRKKKKQQITSEECTPKKYKEISNKFGSHCAIIEIRKWNANKWGQSAKESCELWHNIVYK